LRVKDYCVAKVTAVMPVITAVSTMSLSHCVWLRKASSVSVPGGLARSSICRVHYKPTFHLSSSMHRCRPSNQVSNSCTPQSQLDAQIQRSGWISRVMGKKIHWEETTAGQWVCGHSFACISCFYVSLTCRAFIASEYLGNVRDVVLMSYKVCVRNNNTKNPLRLVFK